jgi:hypothetical protein
VFGHVGSGGITFIVPRKRQTMRRGNVIKVTARKSLRYPIHKLAGQAQLSVASFKSALVTMDTQYRNGGLPAVACHGDHLRKGRL